MKSILSSAILKNRLAEFCFHIKIIFRNFIRVIIFKIVGHITGTIACKTVYTVHVPISRGSLSHPPSNKFSLTNRTSNTRVILNYGVSSQGLTAARGDIKNISKTKSQLNTNSINPDLINF